MYKGKVDSCGKRIAIALKIKGVKQAELCKLANVPKSSLSLYLSGAYEPKQDRVYAIAKALNVNEAWLMGYDVPMERPKENPTAVSDGISEKRRELIEFAMTVPEEKADRILQVMKLIVEAD